MPCLFAPFAIDVGQFAKCATLYSKLLRYFQLGVSVVEVTAPKSFSRVKPYCGISLKANVIEIGSA